MSVEQILRSLNSLRKIGMQSVNASRGQLRAMHFGGDALSRPIRMHISRHRQFHRQPTDRPYCGTGLLKNRPFLPLTNRQSPVRVQLTAAFPSLVAVKSNMTEAAPSQVAPRRTPRRHSNSLLKAACYLIGQGHHETVPKNYLNSFRPAGLKPSLTFTHWNLHHERLEFLERA